VVGVIEAVWERVAVSDGVTDVEDVMEDVEVGVSVIEGVVEDVSVTEDVSDGVKVIEGVIEDVSEGLNVIEGVTEDVSVTVIDPDIEGVGDMESVGDCVIERLGEGDRSATKL